MSTAEVRAPPLRGYRRRKAFLDLNVPPNENREQEGTSSGALSETSQPVPSAPPAPIDVEAIDDDVIESSPRAFAEAKNNSTRSRTRAVVVDLDSAYVAAAGRGGRCASNNRNKRRRIPPNQTVINCEHYINLEASAQSVRQEAPVPVQPPPPPPKEPTFTCPICMGPLTEEMSTRCGHIFCKQCIRAAISTQGKCPTCRKRVTAKELIRVFLPSTSTV